MALILSENLKMLQCCLNAGSGLNLFPTLLGTAVIKLGYPGEMNSREAVIPVLYLFVFLPGMGSENGKVHSKMSI